MTALFDFSYPNVWDALQTADKPIVLYGMGNGADKVLDEFARRGIRAGGVMASDDFCRYQDFRGFTVQKQGDFEQRYGDFLIALCFGSALPDVMQHVYRIAEKHTVLVPNVPVAGDSVMDDLWLDRYRAPIERACHLLADERSRAVYKGVLDFTYTGRPEYLKKIETDKDEAFRNILRLHDEIYLDLGAYRGDTVEEFLRYSDGYQSVTAVEPNPKNYQKLCEAVKNIKNATALHAGIADRVGTMTVSKKGGRMPVLGSANGVEVPVTTVDALELSPTYIKTDVEGMEGAVLSGAVQTLRRYKPKLNLAAYHRTEDFFTLILQLNRINADYRIFLRKHPYIPCWDLNIYAV